eukprot:gi/632972767/ref/XP_007902821.1/ PREDICTED: retinol-binding protein 3 [Callorhinchus milii]
MPGIVCIVLGMLLFGRVSKGETFHPSLVMDMANVLLENYCFPENLVGMKEAIQEAIDSGELLHITDPQTLAVVLSAGVQESLNDHRLVVSYKPGFSLSGLGQVTQPSPEMLLALINQSISFSILEDNVGYLRIDHILGEEAIRSIGPMLVDMVWKTIIHTDTFILDLRYCTSGEVSGIPFLVSYFCDPEPILHIDSVYHRPSNSTQETWTLPILLGERYGKDKDLVVLISRNTKGISEGIAYLLKHLNRATLVGEHTAGGSLDLQTFRIGETDFFITMPVSRSISPITGQSWEVSGVFPCVPAAAQDALEKAKSILGIRKAVPGMLQTVSRLLRTYYSFWERVPALVQQISKVDRSSVVSEEDLASKLNSELQSVSEDPRLIVKVMSEPPVTRESSPTSDKLPEDPTFLQALVDTVFKVSVLPDNTGYFRFDEFPEISVMSKLVQYIIEKVWLPVKDTDRLIVDLRHNVGGHSSVVPLLLSYFYDPEPPVGLFTVYNRLTNTTSHFTTLPGVGQHVYGSRKDIYVLTSHRTATAAEELAYLLQSLNRATIVGEITSGSLLHSRSFQIPSTHLVITIPFINFMDNHGECWLGGGVVPDSIVLAEDTLERTKEIIGFHAQVAELVESTGKLLAVHYAIPEVAAEVSAVLSAKLTQGLYRSVVDWESLASRLTVDLQETSGDHRLHVFYSDLQPEVTDGSAPIIPSPEELSHIIKALFKVEVLPNNIGYLRFDMMADAEIIKVIGPQLLDQVWNKLVDTDSLIFDMRYNTGRYSTAIPILCSYFFKANPVRHLYTVFDRSTSASTEIWTLPKILGRRYASRNDIYILTSHITGSAAEAFTRTMKELNRATVIGEPTVGGALSVSTYRIENSHLYASIPNQVVLSAVTGKVWSVSGAEPHVIVQANEAMTVALGIINLRAKIPSIFQAAGKLVADNYAFAQTGAGVAETIADLIEGTGYGMINTEGKLAEVLSDTLQQLSGDKHLKAVHIPGDSKHQTPGIAMIQMPPPEILEDLVKFSYQTKVLENNVGYLRFDMFGDNEMITQVSELMAKHVWNVIASTSSLIVDLRYNIGGPTSSIPILCSYFFDDDKTVLLDTVYSRPTDTISEMKAIPQVAGERYGSGKTLVVLVSKITSGAAEEFVYIMKKLGRALIVGEVTSGGCHPPQTYQVGDTNLYLTIPTVRSFTPTEKAAWEGIGVTPHIEVPAETALEKAKELMRSQLHGSS